MPANLVMTSSWWLAAAPHRAWQLIADAQAWPRWWRAIAAVQPGPASGAGAGAAAGPTPAWRALLGRPLHLQLIGLQRDPGALLEWRLRGDLHGRCTWVFAATPLGGTDVTCRWDVALTGRGRPGPAFITRALLERSHFARLRACAGAMGVELACRNAALHEWSGASRG